MRTIILYFSSTITLIVLYLPTRYAAVVRYTGTYSWHYPAIYYRIIILYIIVISFLNAFVTGRIFLNFYFTKRNYQRVLCFMYTFAYIHEKIIWVESWTLKGIVYVYNITCTLYSSLSCAVYSIITYFKKCRNNYVHGSTYIQ